MTDINSVARRVQYAGNNPADAGPFSFTFQINSTSEINVYVDGTKKTISTHFTVSLSSSGAGSVSFTSGNFPTNSQTVTLESNVSLARTSVYTTGGPLTAASLETDFDTNFMLHQQSNEKFSRTLTAPVSDPTTIDFTLPTKASRLGAVLGFNASTGAPEAGPTIANVNALSAITANINTVAGISSNVTTVAGISSNVTTVAGIAANVTSVAGVASLITSDFVSDLNTLATTAIVEDLNILATSDIVSDLNTLATSDIVSDINVLATSDIVSDINTLATSDIVSDLNTLATSDIVSDLNTLATTAIVEDLNLLATSSVIADMASLAGSGANPNITTVTASGAITAGSFVIGSADINENDLEAIDGVTAGTVAASKAVVVDTNKDISSFRNVTLTGELDAGSLDVSGDANIAGEVQTTKIAFTDGDDAMTITDTGLVEFNTGFNVGSDASGDILYNNGSKYVRLAKGTDGQLLSLSSGIPAWTTSSSSSAADDISAGDAAVTITTTSGNITIDAAADDSDIIFKGTDGGVDTTFLTLDGSDAGSATFNHNIHMPDGGQFTIGAGNDLILGMSGDDGQIYAPNANLLLDAEADVIIDAKGNDILLKANGTQFGEITNSSTDLVIKSTTSDKDILFKGNDGGSAITALTLDMSNAGEAIFNGAALARGAVVQRSYVTLTSTTQLTSAGSFSELSTSLRIAFTPKHASSVLYAEFHAPYCSPQSNNLYYARVYDVTNSAVASSPPSNSSRQQTHWTKRTTSFDANDMDIMSFLVPIAASNTNARTYTVYVRTEGATLQFLASTLDANGFSAPITFSITEIYNP